MEKLTVQGIAKETFGNMIDPYNSYSHKDIVDRIKQLINQIRTEIVKESNNDERGILTKEIISQEIEGILNRTIDKY